MKTFRRKSDGIIRPCRFACDPEPMSNRSLSPLPSSTRKQVAAWLRRAEGMPVPHATIRISSGPSSSVPG
jgi:hypothetical protein